MLGGGGSAAPKSLYTFQSTNVVLYVAKCLRTPHKQPTPIPADLQYHRYKAVNDNDSFMITIRDGSDPVNVLHLAAFKELAADSGRDVRFAKIDERLDGDYDRRVDFYYKIGKAPTQWWHVHADDTDDYIMCTRLYREVGPYLYAVEESDDEDGMDVSTGTQMSGVIDLTFAP